MNGSSWADRMEKDEVVIDGSRKIVTHHELGDNGKMKKIIRTYEIKSMPRSVAQRKEWIKFGDAVSDGKGVNASTTQVAEEVYLSLTTNKETLEQDDNPLAMIGPQHKMVSCRYCKGDHWSSKCPYKDTLGATTMVDETSTISNQSENPSGATQVSGNLLSSRPGGKYVPPSLRGEVSNKKGEMMSHSRADDDQAAVRVTNLSEDARESDLRELFGRFGSIQRVFLAKDRKTQQSKGFAFIHFNNRDDAQRAISCLDGFGYDHLILKVEWAKPSNPR